MKKLKLLLLTLIGITSMNAQETIKLPSHQKDGGENILKTIDIRRSDRDFTNEQVSLQDLSTILWAGFGYSQNRRTAPTAMNRQDITLYVFNKDGIYKYDAENNTLILVEKGDKRSMTTKGQGEFVNNTLNIAIVSDLDKYQDRGNDIALRFGAFSSAYVSENLYLCCAGMKRNLGSVVRASFDEEPLKKVMHLQENDKIFLFQTIGYKK
jgi:nitroreductase